MKTLIVALYCCFIAQVKGFDLEDVIDEEIVESSSSQPNIVLFYVDDLGFGDLPLYGNPTTYTPNINKMASYGLTFTNFYSSSPVCSPSRAALLTGRYQMRSGIYPGVFDPSDLGGLPHDELTIAEGLKDIGYTTGMVGKWHLGVGKNGTYLPTRHGFDSYFGVPYTHDACPCTTCFYPDVSCREQCQDETEYVGCPLMSNETIVQQPVDLTTLSENIASAAVDFIYNASEPFFLYYAFHHTHWPQFAGKMFHNSSIAGPLGDSLREIDHGVGQIFQALRKTGSYYNTMVIFTADNGPDLEQGSWGGSAGPLRCGKTTTYEGGFRVPTIVWWPGRVKIGRTFRLASSHDWLPTIFKIAGARIPKDRKLDGLDLSSILYYDKDNGKEFVAFFPEFADEDIGPYAIRWKHYKAHFYTSGGNAPPNYHDPACRNTTEFTQHNPPLLYDLWWDTGEASPLDPYQYTWLVEKMYYVRQKFLDDLEWGYPQLEAGKDDSVQPCAVPGCEPWPTCCQIDLLNGNQQNNDNNDDDGGNGNQNNDKDDSQDDDDGGDAKKDDKKLKNSWRRPKWAQL